MEPERPSPARIGYGRVSKDTQDTALQRQALIAAGCWRIVTEEISSGKKRRPGLEDALALCQPGDTLVVYALDRMARSMLETLTIVENLEARSVSILSTTQGFDTSTPMGKFMLGILANFAEFERAMIRQRTSAGLAAAKAKGHFGGRRRALTGAKLKRAKDMLAAGELTQGEIAKALGVSRSTLIRYAVLNGYDYGKRRIELLAKHGDIAEWMARTDDPNFGRNPDRKAS